jgi:mRNA interferase MazF
MEKDFDGWNINKKKVNNYVLNRDFFFHEREIWWCAVGINIGVESDGKNNFFERPVLVIRKFNSHMFWGVPLTSKIKEGVHYFSFSQLDDDLCQREFCAYLTQIRSFSTKRMLRKVGMVDETVYTEIKKRLSEFVLSGYEKIEPPHGEGVLGGRSH